LTFIIAECGVNWRNLAEADLLIKESARAGVDCVKFQCYKPDFQVSQPAETIDVIGDTHIKKIVVKNAVVGHPWANHLNSIALTESDIRYLYYRCQQHEIEFICTPFYLNAVAMLDPYVNRWKIRYKDRLNEELIDKCLATKKEILISCDGSYPRWDTEKDNIKTLYCIPEYPPKTDWNIVNLVKGFDGFSCHFPNWKIPWYVCKQTDLDYLEVHVRLDKYRPAWEPPDQRVSITMKELRQLCKELK
jgi:sialic acid synthase SpsE